VERSEKISAILKFKFWRSLEKICEETIFKASSIDAVKG
jgi:hypothetical protein